MFGTPPCPNCGSEWLVRKIPTGGIFFGHTIERYDLHRCYRCFEQFSPGGERANDETDGRSRSGGDPR